jgi:hypothetical protein
MRERMLNAPVWVRALISGAMFGVLWVLYMRFVQGESWTVALAFGVLAGAFFGALFGPIQHRQLAGVRDAAARSPEGLSARVRRAASRGPVPAEPEIREAAHGLVVAQLRPLERQRIWGPAFFLLMAVLAVFEAVTQSPWWWLAVVFWISVAAGHRYALLRLRRRAELLRR